jgi:hypothetical protein
MVGVVGFSGHGKTVYLTSLFSFFQRFLPYWPGFYYRSLDDFTHRILYEQVPLFERGSLPDSTPANFPSPTLLHYRNLPVFNDAFLAFYDTAGEVFLDSQLVARNGYFVGHSDTVLFIVSLPDLDPTQLDNELSRLLDTYIRAASDLLKVNLAEHQNLIVLFAKSDLYTNQMPPELVTWLNTGTAEWYLLEGGLQRLYDVDHASMQIEEWLRHDLGAHRFLNMTQSHFKRRRFALISATGYVPSDKALHRDRIDFQPLRILDPFFWMIRFAQEDGPAAGKGAAAATQGGANAARRGLLARFFGKRNP